MEKITQIIEMLKMLTEVGTISWKNNSGLYECKYMDDHYEICPMLFTINGSGICIVSLFEDARNFYLYLNSKVVCDSVIAKLNKVCEEKFLN